MQIETVKFLIIVNLLLLVIAYSYNRRLKKKRIKFHLESIKLSMVLKELVIVSQQQRGLCYRYKNGDTGLMPQIDNNYQSIESFINSLEYKYDKFLNSDSRWEKIRNQWVGIKQEFSTFDEEESFTRYSVFIESLLYLIANVAHRGQNNVSDFVTNNEVNIIWENIPSALEAMGKTRAIGSGVASAGVCSQANKIKLKFLNDEIIRNYNMVFNQLNKVSNSEAAKISVGISNVIDEFVISVRQNLIEPSAPMIKSDVFFKQATEAMDGLSKLFDKMIVLKSREIEKVIN